MKKRASRFFDARKARSIREFITSQIALCSILLVTIGLLVYRLLSLVPFGNAENSHAIGSATTSELYNDILLGPVKVLELLILKCTSNDSWIRLASVITGLVTAWLFYNLLRKWHTVRVSVLTSFLFVSSSYFLHASRLASPDVLYLMAIPALLLVILWILAARNNTKLPLAAAVTAGVLYIPSSVLFIIVSSIAFRKPLKKSLTSVSIKLRLLSAATLLVGSLPLLISFAHRPHQVLHWIGINVDQEFSVRAIANHLIDIPQSLFVSGLDSPSRWLTGTPILDIFSIVMLIVGIYAYRAGYYPIRERIVLATLFMSLLIIGLGNVATIGLVLPVLYLLIANGLSYMLQSWFTVFPRNPVARPLGVVLLSILVLGASAYHIDRYFVAWPAAPETKPALITGR